MVEYEEEEEVHVEVDGSLPHCGAGDSWFSTRQGRKEADS